ncbi:16S rRNA (uracil(1498)-N(3))-methyltransferase [Paludibacter sp. 221]|uniref:16S rRNA (uracil(1498)-N(3))-methyltransferase n=1 Tax=Paludibacter sp. 221 TaxID=2302939 RepID=UPI0013D8994C|nr:16S rRNA (uracil(1498)-N(3))-methyltransferase [Paludibacter sp. 221]NDV46717.1 16S rRNA (uracil(1498)-N(3))-methyltransferase [Paludibacter sp. 221]
MIFYAPDISINPVLPEEESVHAVKVLRLQAGSEINITDGRGGFFRAYVVQPHPKHCLVEIVEVLPEIGKRNYKLHLAVAPTKNIERFEWFVEKATEIGVDAITPVITRYSERKVIKPERIQKIIVSASKQSQKSNFPVLNPLAKFEEFVRDSVASQSFIAHCYDDEKKLLLRDACKKTTDSLILIGPEGDFSKEEVEMALSKGFLPVSLGDSRLRTETAGVMACATVQVINQ